MFDKCEKTELVTNLFCGLNSTCDFFESNNMSEIVAIPGLRSDVIKGEKERLKNQIFSYLIVDTK